MRRSALRSLGGGKGKKLQAPEPDKTRPMMLGCLKTKSIVRHAGLVPGIHALRIIAARTWMAGTSPAMTEERMAPPSCPLPRGRGRRKKRGCLKIESLVHHDAANALAFMHQ